MVKDIGIRIKTLRKENKFSQQFIAEKLNISQSAYSLIESAHNNVMINHVITLSDLYKTSTDYILKGEDKLIKANAENGFIPFINMEAVAGRLDSLRNVHEVSDWDLYRVPGFKSSPNHLLFEVEGDSMYPTISQGDVILCEAKDSIDDLVDNSLVVIATEDGLLTKRFTRDNDYFVLESDNKNYTPIKLHKSEVRAMLVVEGRITRRLNEVMVTGNSKIDSMESNIKILEEKLNKITSQFA